MGERLGALARSGDVYLLVGNLGSGKTCLTQGIARGVGVLGPVTSPSFIIANEYPGRLRLYHIDLYRMENLQEVYDLGLDDYFYGDGVCAVEWADRAMASMPPEHLLISLEYLDETRRHLSLHPEGTRYLELETELKRTAILLQQKDA